jgi:transposase
LRPVGFKHRGVDSPSLLVPAHQFSAPDLDSFCLLSRLGLTVTGQLGAAEHTVLRCRVVEPDDPVERDCWCHRCGGAGVPRDTVTRRLAHAPVGWRPTILHVTIRRYRCAGCGLVWRQDTSAAAAPRSKPAAHAVLWALRAVLIDRASIARVAAALGTAWHTVNSAVLAAGRTLLIDDPSRLDAVKVLGVDEHCWRHPRAGAGPVQRFVTVVIDLIPVRDKTGPARLLDIVGGRSKQVFAAWLAAQTPAFRAGIETVAMDGFTGFKTTAAEAIPKATAVMDPFHVVALAGDAVDRHTWVQATWGIYQRIVAAYRNPDRTAGKAELTKVIAALSTGVPRPLSELITLGRTLRRRAADVGAYFDRPGTSNGPTEAINGRLEHLRGTALGFRNLGN